jgi:hypothetical protein
MKAYNIQEMLWNFMMKQCVIKIAINPLTREIKTIMLFQITLPICLIYLNRINLTKL